MAAGPHGNRGTHPGPSISRAQRDCQDRVARRLAVSMFATALKGQALRTTASATRRVNGCPGCCPPRRAGQARLIPQKIGGPITRSTNVRLRAMIDR
jgi:hypothetical protein